MPVTQLTDQDGPAALIGMVGGYLAGNAGRKARKAQQDIENKRNAANDAQTARRDQDYHDEVQANIQKGQAETQHTADADAYKNSQNGLYSSILAQLPNRPQNTTAPQWIAHLQQQAQQQGLTDHDLQNDLYTKAQEYLAKDQVQQNADFARGEMPVPSDPNKALSIYQKRLQVEKGRPGFDLKPTEDAITAAQKQIAAAHASAYQAATQKERERHDEAMESNAANRIQISLDRGASGRASAAGDATALADVSSHLRTAKTRDQAQTILDSSEGSLLSDRQYTRLQKQVDSTFGTHSQADPRAPKKTEAELRDADFRNAKQVYDQPNSDKNAIVNSFAAKWRLTPQQAKVYFR
jgi:hypothetical protein